MTPAKRLLDIIVALIIIVLVALPFLLVLVLLLLTEGRPLFYISERMQTPTKGFSLIKLRTMRPSAENTGVTGGDKSDRIPPVYRWLRKSRFDEIPQLWNVLNGTMSLVGPRPMMVSQQALYPGASYYNLRPGITGSWQISERNSSTFASRAEYDAAYAQDLTFRNDLGILFATVGVVVKATGY